jgi:hypothetical protein
MIDYKKTEQFKIIAQQQAIQNEIAVNSRNLEYQLPALQSNIARLKKALLFAPNIRIRPGGDAGGWVHKMSWVLEHGKNEIGMLKRLWAYLVFAFIFKADNTEIAK